MENQTTTEGRGMIGKKAKSSSSSTSSDNSNNNNDNQHQTQLGDLPNDLLRAILYHLPNVSTQWLATTTTVRTADQHPWLIILSTDVNHTYQLFDPLNRKLHWLSLPELADPGGLTKVLYANRGWLLLHEPAAKKLLLFSPYTKETLQLPQKRLNFDQKVAFSSPAPNKFTVFVVRRTPLNALERVEVSTWHLGDGEWRTTATWDVRRGHPRFYFLALVAIAPGGDGDFFYCLDEEQWLGIFGVEDRSIEWIPSPALRENFGRGNIALKGSFVAEYGGDVFVVFHCMRANEPKVFRLNKAAKVWDELNTLNGLAIFASHHSPVVRAGLLLRNKIYFSKVRYTDSQCFSYSFEDSQWRPWKMTFELREADRVKSVWVDPPEDVSMFP